MLSVCSPSLDLRLRFLTALTFVVLVIRSVARNIKELTGIFNDFFKALCGKFDIIWFWSALSPPAWSFSTWGLVPRLSKTTLLLNCLLITKTISFFNDISFWPWFHLNVPHEIACWCLKLREILPLLETYQPNFYHSMAYSTSTCTH